MDRTVAATTDAPVSALSDMCVLCQGICGRDAVDNIVELISRKKDIQLKLSSKDLIEKFLKESKLM